MDRVIGLVVAQREGSIDMAQRYLMGDDLGRVNQTVQHQIDALLEKTPHIDIPPRLGRVDIQTLIMDLVKINAITSLGLDSR